MATFVVDPLLMRRRLNSEVFNFARSLIGSRQNNAERLVTGMKPPNILVYYPMGNVTQSCIKDCLISATEQCVPPTRYVVYSLNHDIAIKDPWMDNCRVLIIPSMGQNLKSFDDADKEVFEEYLSRKGKIINFNESVMSSYGFNITRIVRPIEKFKAMDTVLHARATGGWGNGIRALSCERNDDYDVVLAEASTGGETSTFAVSVSKGGGQIVHCSLPLLRVCSPTHCTESPCDSTKMMIQELLKSCGFTMLTEDLNVSNSSSSATQTKKSHCYLLGADQEQIPRFLSSMGAAGTGPFAVKGFPISLKLSSCDDLSRMAGFFDEEDPLCVPVFYSLSRKSFPPMMFNWDEYQNKLTSKAFGKLVLYSDLVTSTMDIVEPIVGKLAQMDNMNITCIARQQSKGKGRGGNKWLSPPGTAMFTTAFSIPLKSLLGQNLSIVQHLMTVAVVHAVRSIPGLEELDMRVKWPNDIYIGNSVKIGGVLVKSTIFQHSCIVTIGCGVNVNNEFPTRCINDAISAGNFSVDQLTCETVLAISISCLEGLIDSYQSRGAKEFLDLYYNYWIHSGQSVQVRLQKDGVDTDELINAKVIGIDAGGYLRVVSVDQKSTFHEMSLQPDSNSFDMTKNLIAMKSYR